MSGYLSLVRDDLKPTFENVTREFITKTMYKILFSERIPNFRFDFREEEAINFIEDVLEKNSSKKEVNTKIMEELKKGNEQNSELPIMIVKDYKKFFEMLKQYYEEDINLFFKRTWAPMFREYEKNNCFEQIWLRATPDDFKEPEEFLRKQLIMAQDTTFKYYDAETYLGVWDLLEDKVLCVRNGIARTWDESLREMEFSIYDKQSFCDQRWEKRLPYILPLIRYGIYQKDGEKVCRIASIQNKSDETEKNELRDKLNRKKYKANKGLEEEDTYKVEPKNIIVLSMFINLLHNEGISKIEVPGFYVLDYEYHIKRNKDLLEDFEEVWSKEKIEKKPEEYQKAKEDFNKRYQKQDLISELKTERLLLTVRRLLQHYKKGTIISYPGDADSFMHLDIPIVKDENEIEGSIFKELYKLQKRKNKERT